MGFKEDLILDWKGYTIEYQGKKLYVLEQLEYNGNTYLCVIHMDQLPNTVYNFLKKESSTVYENVEDEKLLNDLMIQLGQNKVLEEIEKAKKENGLK